MILDSRYDVTRLAIVLALEGAGHEFFGRFVPLVQRTLLDEEFLFFGRTHQQAEANHRIDVWSSLFARPLDGEATHEMAVAVQATFAEMARIAQAMEDALLSESQPELEHGQRP